MTPATGTAILVIGIFVLPGFVTVLFRERAYVVREDGTPFDRLMLALFYSALIYAFVFVVVIIAGADREDIVATYNGKTDLRISLGVAAGVVLGLPALVAWSGACWRRIPCRPKVLQKLGLSDAHSIRSGWNAMFSREGTALVRVVLKSGGVVGGWYGKGSLSGYSEHGGDLFIAERWELDDDDWFKQPAPGSLGIWIAHDEIQTVQLYEAPKPTHKGPAASPLARTIVALCSSIVALRVAWRLLRGQQSSAAGADEPPKR